MSRLNKPGLRSASPRCGETFGRTFLCSFLLLLGWLGLSVPVVAVDKLAVMGLGDGVAIVLVDGKRRVLKVGKPSPEGLTLISADSEVAVIELAGRQTSYGLGTHIASEFAPPETTSVRIWPTANRMYEVVGSINGAPVGFLVDTGATLISMNSNQARRLGLDYRLLGEEAVSSTASGLSKVYLLSLEEVRVGDIRLRNVGAAVHDGDFPTEVLLGMSFLGRLDMRREGEVLELTKKF